MGRAGLRRKQIERKDTIELMQSPDYKKRFMAEYFQAVIRLKKLYAMLKKWEAGTLEFTPTSSKEALYGQYALMTGYIRILLDRATEEGIELPRVENV